MRIDNIIIKLIEAIKDLPPLYRIIALVLIVILIVIYISLNKKKKNSDNFKKTIFNGKTNIEIGNINCDKIKHFKDNSDNFKKSKFYGNVNIKIGDKSDKEK